MAKPRIKRISERKRASRHWSPKKRETFVRFKKTLMDIATGVSVTDAASKNGWSNREKFYQWMNRHPEYKVQYDRARELSCDAHMDKTLEIADSPKEDAVAVAHANLMIKARSEYAKRINPNRYGDKITQDINTSDTKPVLNVQLTSIEQDRPRDPSPEAIPVISDEG